LRLLIDFLSFPPVSCSDDTDHALTVSESDCQDAIPHFAETVVPLFGLAVTDILCNHTTWVSECILRQAEWNSMFLFVLSVLLLVPLKPNFIHKESLPRNSQKSNINIHIFVWHFLIIRQSTPRGHYDESIAACWIMLCKREKKDKKRRKIVPVEKIT
jgi:hypothetical protein